MDSDSGDCSKLQKPESNPNYHGDPLHLASSEHRGMQLTAKQLDGNNFSNWSRSVKMALGSKLKIGFIDGSCEKPVEGSVDYFR